MAVLQEIVFFLDREMNVTGIEDDSLNGLQFEGRHGVQRVACAVDACAYSFEKAVEGGADLLVVHHGMLWRNREPTPCTGVQKKKLKLLVENDLSVYACHLPLDLHSRYGNNALIAKAVGVVKPKRWGDFHGTKIGFWGALAKPVSLKVLASRVAGFCGGESRVLSYGARVVRRVGVVSGGGGSAVAEAAVLGLDAFVVGELKQHEAVEARDLGLSVVEAGHYNTETAGVKALGRLLEKKFGVKSFFVDAPTGV
jgi:dinuclear metal center YbgI/SA1388 family protein